VHTLLFQAVTFLLRPTASYRAVELGVPTGWLGLLAASFALVPLLVALPAGDAADRFGEGRILVLGAVVVSGSGILYVLGGRSFAALLGATVVLGTGHLLCAVGQQAMVANLVPHGSLDRAFGYYTFAGSLGQSAGPGLLALFGASGSVPRTDDAFLAATGVALVLVAVTLCARSTPMARSRGPRAERKVRLLIRTPGLLRALLVSSVVVASMDITLVYLPALGAEQGLTVGVVGGLLVARGLAAMASRLFLGHLVRLVGRRALLVSSIAAAGIAVAAVPFPVPLAVSFIALVVLGFGLGVCQPLTLSWLAEIAPPGLRGRVMSIRLVGNRLGQVVIPSMMGLLAAGLGAAGVLWLTAGALVGAATAGRSVPMDTRAPDD
jgi:MFS family permease